MATFEMLNKSREASRLAMCKLFESLPFPADPHKIAEADCQVVTLIQSDLHATTWLVWKEVFDEGRWNPEGEYIFYHYLMNSSDLQFLVNVYQEAQKSVHASEG